MQANKTTGRTNTSSTNGAQQNELKPNLYYMQLALEQAQKAFDKNEVPVGAVIIHATSGQIIARAHNLCETKTNPTLHAEIIAIQTACKKLSSKNLSEYEIFVSKEPCPMCATALSYTRIKKIHFALSDEKGGAIENGPKLFDNKPETRNLFKPQYESGLLKDESTKLLKTFFKKLR